MYFIHQKVFKQEIYMASTALRDKLKKKPIIKLLKINNNKKEVQTLKHH